MKFYQIMDFIKDFLMGETNTDFKLEAILAIRKTLERKSFHLVLSKNLMDTKICETIKKITREQILFRYTLFTNIPKMRQRKLNVISAWMFLKRLNRE